MSNKFNAESRHQIPKMQFKVTNWAWFSFSRFRVTQANESGPLWLAVWESAWEF